MSTTDRTASLTGFAPDAYQRTELHSASRAYVESNCYTDVIVELLHARGLEPLAMFGHLVRMDFEGDQWTFFKPPPEDLESLYGVDIHEMQPYRPLPGQISEQLTSSSASQGTRRPRSSAAQRGRPAGRDARIGSGARRGSAVRGVAATPRP